MGPVGDHPTGAERAEEPVALGHVETRTVQKGAGPDEQRSRPGAARDGQVRGNPEQGFFDVQADRCRPGRAAVAVAEPRGGGAADRRSTSCRHVRRLGRVHQVAGGEDPGALVAPSPSHAGPFVPGSIDSRARRASSLSGMKSPVKTTTSTATVRSASSGPRRSTPSRRSRPVTPVTVVRVHTGTWRPMRVARSKARNVWVYGRSVTERDGVDACFAQGQHRGVRDVLGPHNERPAGEGETLPVHPLLQLAGREDPRGSRARNEARCPRPLPRPGGKDDGTGLHLQQAVRAGHLGPARGRPCGHHGTGPDVHAGGDRPLHPAAGVGRAAQDASQIAQAEAGVLAQAGRPTRLVLPVEHHDVPGAARSERGRRGQAGGPGSDHECVDPLDGARHPVTAPPAGPQWRRRRKSPDSAHWWRACAGAGPRGPWRAPLRRGRRVPRRR